MAHGNLNVEGAIENSCNSFFYEVGYRMSLKDNGLSQIGSDNAEGGATNAYYSSDLGTDTLKKYATEFGLGETSGLEIPESEPQISDKSSVLPQSDRVRITILPASLRGISPQWLTRALFTN